MCLELLARPERPASVAGQAYRKLAAAGDNQAISPPRVS